LGNGLSLVGKVIAGDEEADIAMIKVSKVDYEHQNYLKFSRRTAERGQQLTIIGYPLATEKEFEGQATVTQGIFSAIRDGLYGVRYIQTDATIKPGNSGGPVINKCGRVVGISNWLYNFAQDEEESGFTTPTFFAIEVASIEQRMKTLLGSSVKKIAGTRPKMQEADYAVDFVDFVFTGAIGSDFSQDTIELMDQGLAETYSWAFSDNFKERTSFKEWRNTLYGIRYFWIDEDTDNGEGLKQTSRVGEYPFVVEGIITKAVCADDDCNKAKFIDDKVKISLV
jgi:hypothetical protein